MALIDAYPVWTRRSEFLSKTRWNCAVIQRREWAMVVYVLYFSLHYTKTVIYQECAKVRINEGRNSTGYLVINVEYCY